MVDGISRRGFLGWTAALPALGGGFARAQQAPARYDPQPVFPCERRAVVSLTKGEQRRKLIHDALVAIDDQIRPLLKRKKYVVIKPNNVSTVNQLASTHADTLRGILDYLAQRTKGPVVIAESSAGDTMEGFHNFKYPEVAREFRSLKVSLVDLNDEARYVVIPLLSPDLHVQPVRLAGEGMDQHRVIHEHHLLPGRVAPVAFMLREGGAVEHGLVAGQAERLRRRQRIRVAEDRLALLERVDQHQQHRVDGQQRISQQDAVQQQRLHGLIERWQGAAARGRDGG
jgi:hypothetical protein